MKKLLGLLTSAVLALTFAFSLTACKSKSSSSGDDSKAYTATYELDEENDTYTFTGFTVSQKALELAEKKDFAALAELFNEDKADGDADFTAETVKTLTVKSEYEGKPVTKIAGRAVSGLTFIEKIVVPDSVTEIAAMAFSNLKGLKEITLPFTGKSVDGLLAERSFGYIFDTTSADGLTSCAQTYYESKDASTTYYIPTAFRESARATVSGRNSAICFDKTSTDEFAASDTILNFSLYRRTVFTTCLPIDPVEPSNAILIIFTVLRPIAENRQTPYNHRYILLNDRANYNAEDKRGYRGYERQPVYSVHHSAVSREKFTHIFYTEFAFDYAFRQISQFGKRGEKRARNYKYNYVRPERADRESLARQNARRV